MVVTRYLLLVLLLFSQAAPAQVYTFDENSKTCIDKETWLPGNNTRGPVECVLVRRMRWSREDYTNYYLPGARIELSVLRGVNLTGADLRYASFLQTSMEESTLVRAKALNTIFLGTVLEGVDAKLINAVNANFSGAKAAGAQFGGANLAGSIFVGADLFKASFVGANLVNADLSGANVLLTDFSKAIYNEKTKLPFSDEEANKRGMIRRND